MHITYSKRERWSKHSLIDTYFPRLPSMIAFGTFPAVRKLVIHDSACVFDLGEERDGKRDRESEKRRGKADWSIPPFHPRLLGSVNVFRHFES